MAFKFPFLSEDRDTVDRMKSNAKGAINTVLGLGPLGIAAYSNYSNIKSNSPDFLSKSLTNQAGDIHSSVGESFDRFNLMRSKVIEAKKMKTKKQFEKVSDFVDNLASQKNSVKTAFLANLSSMLDDPNVFENDRVTKVEMFKKIEVLLEQAFQGSDGFLSKEGGEARQNLIDIIEDIKKSDPDGNALKKIGSFRSSPFSSVSDLLVAPQSISLKGINPGFTNLQGNVSEQGQSVLNYLKSNLQGADFNVITRTETIGNVTGNVEYAQISRNGKVLQTLPLNLREFANKGVVPVRFGNTNTLYAGPQIFAEAQGLNNILKENSTVMGRKKAIQSQLLDLGTEIRQGRLMSSNNPFMLPEVGIANIFIQGVKSRGGLRYLSSRDVSSINANIAQSLEFVERAGGDDEVNRFLGSKFKSIGMGMKILNPMQLSGKDQFNLRPQLSQMHSLFDFGADPFSSGKFNFSMGGMAINQGFLGSMKAGIVGGQSVLEQAGAQFGGDLVDRVTQPITARYRQMYNRDEFLANTKNLADDARGRTVAVLDVFGKDRIGVGEGMAVYHGNRDVKKAITKPINDPSQTGGVSSFLFEELRYRAGSDSNKALKVGESGSLVFEMKSMKSGGKEISSVNFLRNLIKERGMDIANRVSVESTDAGNAKLIYKNIDDFYKLFGSQLDNYGIFLGAVDGRRQIFQRYSGIKSFSLRLSEEMESRGTTKFSITGSRTTRNDYMKIFSTGFKGVAESTTRSSMEEAIGRTKMSSALRSRILNYGDISEGVLATEASMLKKASMNLAEQIMTSLNVLGVSQDSNEDFSRRLMSRGMSKIKPGEEVDIATRNRRLITSAIQEAVKSYGTDLNQVEKQGLSFGYFAKTMKGEGGVYGIDKEGFFDIVKKEHQALGLNTGTQEYAQYQEKLGKEISKGFAVGHFKSFMGPQASTLGANMGSMEPRVYNFLSQNLRTLGVSDKGVSEFMFSLLSRKKGTYEDISALKEFTKSMRSLSGLSSGQEEMKGVKRIGVSAFLDETGMGGDDKAMRKFLEKQEGGFVLDLSEDKNLKNLFSVAKKGKGKLPGEIYIPAGKDFLQLLDNERTLIPSNEGMKEIDSPYVRTMQKFALNLTESIQAKTYEEKVHSLRFMQEFKSEMSEFYGMKFRNILRGKIQGSTFAIGAAVNLGRFGDDTLSTFIEKSGDGSVKFKNLQGLNNLNKASQIFTDIAETAGKGERNALLTGSNAFRNLKTNEERRAFLSNVSISKNTYSKYIKQNIGTSTYTESERYLMRKMQRSAVGTAVFTDTNTFLSAMQGYMAGGTDEFTLSRSRSASDAVQAVIEGRKDARKSLAGKLQRFFLGSYEGSNLKNRDINISGRHPNVGLQHSAITTYFRNVREAGRGSDIFFENISRSREGQKALSHLEAMTGKKFTSFSGMLDYLKNPTHQALSVEDIQKNLIKQYESEFDLVAERISRGSLTEIEGEQATERLARKIDESGTKAASIRKNFSKEKLISSFFQKMTYFMGDMATGAGGGAVTIPEMLVDIHYGKKGVVKLDLSMASGMIGDFDGDIYQLIFPSRKAASAANLTDKKTLRKASETAMLYRAKTQMIFDFAKEGIANVAKDLKAGTPTNVLMGITEDAMKEQIGKNVGPLDVSLDALRLGLINTVDAADNIAVTKSADAINLLGVIQEVANIKGKKLPTASPIAETIAFSINKMIESGGKSDDAFKLFERQIRNVIFRGVDLDGQFGKVASATGGLGFTIGKSLEGQKVLDMDDFFKTIRSIMPHVLEAGYREQKTERRIAAASLQESRAQTKAFQGMLYDSVQAKLSGLDKTYNMEDAAIIQNKLFNYLNKNITQAASSSRLGVIAAGLAGSLFVSSSLGYGGYSAEPLMMDGEMVSPELSDAIRSGNAFDAGQTADDYMSMQNSVNNDIINRNINLGETLMTPNRSFRMRGEAGSMGAISDLTSIVNQMGGRGHFTMNDTRGPITQHHIQRKYMGE